MTAAVQHATTSRAKAAAPAARVAASARQESARRGMRGDAGNQLALARLRGASIQPRLNVNAPGDAFEQEADRVADHVMRMSAVSVAAGAQPPRIQRKCAGCACDMEPARVQRRCAACEEELHRKARGAQSPQTGERFESDIAELRTGGAPLPRSTREFFEPRFGRDFSSIRVHSGARAAALASEVNALAFTARNHIVFGGGQFSPETSTGRNLLAHELTHTIQQGTGSELATASIQRRGDRNQIRQPLGCDAATDYPATEDEHLEFVHAGSSLTDAHKAKIRAVVDNWRRSGGNAMVRIDGYASPSGSETTNWRISCERANAVKAEMITPTDHTLRGIDPRFLTVRAQGEETKFNDNSLSDPEGPNRRVGISVIAAPTPVPTPVPTPAPPPPCPGLPTTTPANCAARNAAYCAAETCFPANSWLNCVCVASADVCRAISAFDFSSFEGQLLDMCVAANGSSISHSETVAKSAWLLATNSCIWGHWRAAFDAIHDPAQPVPSTLTTEWARAVRICRSSGIGSGACCRAHVTAEQMAINRCGAYPSARFGRLPTEVPGAPFCSDLTRSGAPGLPFPIAADFGNVADRIAYGIRRCGC